VFNRKQTKELVNLAEKSLEEDRDHWQIYLDNYVDSPTYGEGLFFRIKTDENVMQILKSIYKDNQGEYDHLLSRRLDTLYGWPFTKVRKIIKKAIILKAVINDALKKQELQSLFDSIEKGN